MNEFKADLVSAGSSYIRMPFSTKSMMIKHTLLATIGILIVCPALSQEMEETASAGMTEMEDSKVSAREKKLMEKAKQETAKREKLLRKYRKDPGKLEELRQEKLSYLQRPEPVDNHKLVRRHQHDIEQIKKAAVVIDERVMTKLEENEQTFNPLTTDEQFVRRLYVDIAGRIPSMAETQAFISSNNPDKRSELIDELLLGDDYPKQMFNWLADMLRVQEIKSNQGDSKSYQAWLMDQVEGNRPWNEVVQELITAEGNVLTNPATGWLMRDRGVLTNSVSNTLTIFMGANVACAECHDHPFGDWSQREFYEMAAFFGATELPSRKYRKLPRIAYHTVRKVEDHKGQYLEYPEDYAYDDVKPSSRVTPRFAVMRDLAPLPNSREADRTDFAAWITHPQNEQFAATIGNRLWKKAFGRAVLEPVTVMDDLDAADNPGLLKELARMVRDSGFDLLAVQRVIYNTRAYQAQSSVTPDLSDSYHFPGPIIRRMTAEQTWDSLVGLVRGPEINDYERNRWEMEWIYQVFKHDAFDDYEGNKLLEYEPLFAAGTKLSNELKREVRRNSKVDKFGESLARASERRQPENDMHFLRQFGQSERELADSGARDGGVPQVLMLMNGKEYDILTRGNSHLMNLVNKAKGVDEKVSVIYMSFFNRMPTQEERRIISDEDIAINDLVWMLMNSREFIFIT